MIFLILFSVLIPGQFCGFSNKSSEGVTICPTYEDYNENSLHSNPKCHIEPFGNLETWMKELNCTVETYEITTADKYILTLRHLYCGKITGTFPFLIGHGISSNDTTIFLGGKKSAGYALLTEGYETWLMNFRGTTSSRHENLSKSDMKFWEFSFHELGVYDYPSAIEFIRNFDKKKYGAERKIVMVGLSLGSLALSVFGSELPDYSSKVSIHHIHIAPVHSYFRNQPLHRAISMLWPVLKVIFQYVLKIEYFSLGTIFKQQGVCLKNKEAMRTCQALAGAIGGYNLEVVDPETFPIFCTYAADTSSVQSLLHGLQNIKSFGFRKYDYGPIHNMRIYNSIKPPKYLVSNMRVNTTYFTSKNDGFAKLQDTKKFYYEKLPESIQAGLYVMEPKKFSHADYSAYNKYSLNQFVYPYFIPVVKQINPLL